MPPGPVPMRTTLQTQEDSCSQREKIFPSTPVTGILAFPKWKKTVLINNTNTSHSNYNMKNSNIGLRASLSALKEDFGSVPSTHSSQPSVTL